MTHCYYLSIGSMISIKLLPLNDADDKVELCRALSSDEDSFCEVEKEVKTDSQGQEPLPSSTDLHSSGYSSVQSVSPSSTCSSTPLVPCTFKTYMPSLGAASANAQPGFHLLVPMQRPRGTSSKQVKRKNSAAHSGGEIEREEDEDREEDRYSNSVGFLSL